MIERLFGGISNFLDRVLGRTTLLPHETLCLEAWRASLSEAHKRILDSQLSLAYLVQRQAAGAKVCFYYRDQTNLPLFGNLAPDSHVATVALASRGSEDGQSLRVKIFLNRGRFFSIEFPKRPERYAQQHGMRFDALQVAAVEARESLD